MDLAPYVARLALTLPLVLIAIVGGLWLVKRLMLARPGFGAMGGLAGGISGIMAGTGPIASSGTATDVTAMRPPGARASGFGRLFGGGGPAGAGSVALVETLFLGPGMRLAVVAFADKRLLLAVGKGGIVALAETASVRSPSPSGEHV